MLESICKGDIKLGLKSLVDCHTLFEQQRSKVQSINNSVKQISSANRANAAARIEVSDSSEDDIKQSKKKKANKDQIDWFCKQMQIIRDKSRCYDMFQKTKVKGLKMYRNRTIKDTLFYSMEQKKLS